MTESSQLKSGNKIVSQKPTMGVRLTQPENRKWLKLVIVNPKVLVELKVCAEIFSAN